MCFGGTSMRTALVRIAEPRPGVFAVVPVHPETMQDQEARGSIIRIEAIPDGIEWREITDLLTRLPDLTRPPNRCSFAELKKIVENPDIET